MRTFIQENKDNRVKIDEGYNTYTPLNIYNGTPIGVPLDVSMATLPIN